MFDPYDDYEIDYNSSEDYENDKPKTYNDSVDAWYESIRRYENSIGIY